MGAEERDVIGAGSATAAAAGDGGQAVAGSEAPGGQVEAPAAGVDAQKLAEENRLLRAQLEQMQQTLMSPELVEAVRARRLGFVPPAQVAPPTPPQPEPEPDFESMTPQQLADFVVKKVKESIDPLLKQQEQKAGLLDARMQIAECEKKYPDYWSYRELMATIAAQNPTLTAEEVYLQAKGRVAAMAAQGKQKVVQAAQSLAKEPPQTTTQQPQQKKQPTVSERPHTATGSVSRNAPVGFQEAFDEAWEKTFGKG